MTVKYLFHQKRLNAYKENIKKILYRLSRGNNFENMSSASCKDHSGTCGMDPLSTETCSNASRGWVKLHSVLNSMYSMFPIHVFLYKVDV